MLKNWGKKRNEKKKHRTSRKSINKKREKVEKVENVETLKKKNSFVCVCKHKVLQ